MDRYSLREASGRFGHVTFRFDMSRFSNLLNGIDAAAHDLGIGVEANDLMRSLRFTHTDRTYTLRRSIRLYWTGPKQVAVVGVLYGRYVFNGHRTVSGGWVRAYPPYFAYTSKDFARSIRDRLAKNGKLLAAGGAAIAGAIGAGKAQGQLGAGKGPAGLLGPGE